MYENNSDQDKELSLLYESKEASRIKVIVIDEEDDDTLDSYAEEMDLEYRIGFEKDREQIDNLHAFICYGAPMKKIVLDRYSGPFLQGN